MGAGVVKGVIVMVAQYLGNTITMLNKTNINDIHPNFWIKHIVAAFLQFLFYHLICIKALQHQYMNE